MKKGWLIVAAILIVLYLFGSCSDSSGSSSYSGYSSSYQNDSSYRNDVSEIADAFGISEREVDSKINAIADAMD